MEIDTRSGDRYKALDSVARTHFINNLITALLAMNMKEERYNLGEALHRLGGLFYYLSERHDTARLSDERRFLEDYLELLRLRFEDRLSYRIIQDRAEEETLVPRFRLFLEVRSRVERRLEASLTPFELIVDCRRIEGKNKNPMRICIRNVERYTDADLPYEAAPSRGRKIARGIRS